MARTSRTLAPVVPQRRQAGMRARAAWRTLPARALVAHLLASPRISDAAWAPADSPRLPGESRPEFVRRVAPLVARAARSGR